MFRIIAEGLNFRENILLKNGKGLLLRPAMPEDISLVESFMSRLSEESLRMRFMATVSQVPQQIIEDLCNGDFTEKGCLLAVAGEGEKPQVVGLGNYISTGTGRIAEVAFLIEDAYQGLGISTILLERLAGIAAANGYIEFEAEVLPENHPMIGVFKHSGFRMHQAWSSDTVHIELPVSGASALWERAALRERIAVANSLVPLLRPKTVAVIGASRDQSSIGNMVFRNMLTAGFKGTVYPVNPQADSINGVKAYDAIKNLPEKIDLSVIAVPADTVLEVAEKSIRKGAKALVVVTAGFAEAGEEGRRRQEKLISLTQQNGVRLLGPSCLGLMNTNPAVCLNASLAPELAPAGGAGFFSHSAALGLVILEYAMELGIGFSSFISAGNRADVSGNDLLQYWEEDNNTKMAILYLEIFRNPRKFVRIARRMSYRKPILSVISAHSYAGRRTAAAKSGGRAVSAVEEKALMKQTGIILAETLEELFDVALVLEHQPLPNGNQVAVIANSAGIATIFADACEANGLELAGPGLMNLGAFASAADYEQAVLKAYQNEKVHSLLIGFACVGDCNQDDIAAAIRRAVHSIEETHHIEKPVLLCMMGVKGSITLFQEDSIYDSGRMFPAFRFPESAPRALAKIVHYAEYLKNPPGKIVWHDDVNGDNARFEVKAILDNSKSEHTLVEINRSQITSICSHFGITMVESKSGRVSATGIHVKTDSLFGPLLYIEPAHGNRIVRITPLTERDLDETVEEIGGQDRAMKQVLGRVSQMIEELPWLWELKLTVVEGDEARIFSDVLMVLKRGGAERPEY